MKRNNMLNRDKVMEQAIHDCFVECYKKAQPSADYDELVKLRKEGKITDTPNDKICDRYYLSHEEGKFIVDKYINAYQFTNSLTSNTELLVSFLKDPIEEVSVADENGCYSREYSHLDNLSSQIGEENTQKVNELIHKFTEFYNRDFERSQFSIAMYLGAMPTSNKDRVVEYWKNHGKDIDIEDRKPATFWYRDYYGEDWKEVWDEEENLINENLI